MDNSYKNGKIYKIIDNTNGNFYVGSTNYVKLCSRMGKHRGYLKEYMNGSSQKYCASMEILINENYKINKMLILVKKIYVLKLKNIKKNIKKK